MNVIGKLFSTICIITYFIPAYGQGDTITADGLYLKYNKLKMIKWGQDFSVSFLVTKKGEKNIDKYIRDVENAFLFED